MIRLAIVTTFVFLFGCTAPEASNAAPAAPVAEDGVPVDSMPVPQPDQA